MKPVLSVRNLQSGYGDLRLVWDVSFDVYPGQVTALLGRRKENRGEPVPTGLAHAVGGLGLINILVAVLWQDYSA